MRQRGFVRKRNRTWTTYFHTVDAGVRHQRTKGGFATKAAAQAHLLAELADLYSGTYIPPNELTHGGYLVEHWLPLQARSLRPSTLDGYRRLIEIHILPTVGEWPLQSIASQHLDRLYGELLEHGSHRTGGEGTGLSAKTVRSVHALLHKALKDAVRKRLIQRNVVADADPPKLRCAEATLRTWTAGELRTFIDGTAEHPLGVAFLLAATTGMRRGEVLGVRWQDVDLETRRLAVRQTVLSVNYRIVLGAPKTSRSRRLIALDPYAVAALRRRREVQADKRKLCATDLVFTTEDGSPVHPDSFSQVFERSVRRLGLPRIRLHDLRHTHATLGLIAGIPAKIMSDRLGHSTVAFTQDRYMHAIPQLQEEAATTVGALVFGVSVSNRGDTEHVFGYDYE
jgi:integrase